MSETDSFIEEVTEEVRNDRLFALAKRYGWIVGLGLISIVAGTAYFEYKYAQETAMSQARGDAILEILAQPKPDQNALFADFAQSDQSVLSNLFLAQGDSGADALNAVIENQDNPEYLRDVARLRLAALPDALENDERVTILTNLSQAGSLYRTTALDLLVLVHIENGEIDRAVELMKAAMDDAITDPEQSRRFMELMIALGLDQSLAS